MPIRFRCPKCRQLLGISGRKGGTQVKCPTCASQVEVPRGQGGEGEGEASVKPEGAPLLFERTDFDDLFKVPRADKGRPKAKSKLSAPERPDVRSPRPAPRGSPKPVLPSPPAPAAEPAVPRSLQESAVEVEWVAMPGHDGKNVELAAERVGLVLSPVMATIAGVIFVVGMIAAFAAGLLLGYLLFKPAGDERGTRAGGAVFQQRCTVVEA